MGRKWSYMIKTVHLNIIRDRLRPVLGNGVKWFCYFVFQLFLGIKLLIKLKYSMFLTFFPASDASKGRIGSGRTKTALLIRSERLTRRIFDKKGKGEIAIIYGFVSEWGRWV